MVKNRIAILTIISVLTQYLPALSQISYIESGDQWNVEHFYGTGAPGGGVSFFDFNQDGLDDLTLGGIKGQGVSFFINKGNSFEQIAPLAHIPFEVKQILWADYDNDGDPDLYVACFDGRNMLFNNYGSLALYEATSSVGLPFGIHRGFGALWADFNRDGWLDIYYVKRRTDDEQILNENRMFLNQAGNSFIEVTDPAGVADRGRKPFCSVAIDYDNDKWPDIYINNDKQSINTMLHNNGDGTFEDVSVETQTNIQMDAMGTALGDYNNDGWLDMYVSNIPEGNVLLRNNGPDEDRVFTFTDVAEASNTGFYGVAWGTNFLDADNDGDLDLYVNSMLSGESQINSTLYENLGNGTFNNLEGNLIGDTCVSFSNAVGDFNYDGIADLAVVNQAGFRTQLWKSQKPVSDPNHYLKIKLQGVLSNRDGVGTRIEVYAGGKYQMRYTHCGISFMGQNSGTEIIGLAENSTVDSIRITWPTGHVDFLLNILADQTIEVIEGSTTNGEINVDPEITIISSTNNNPDNTYQLFFYPNPSNDQINFMNHYTGTYRIINPEGKIGQTGVLSGENKITLSGLPAGFYRMHIISDDTIHTGHFIKGN